MAITNIKEVCVIYTRHLIKTYNWDVSCPNSPGGSINPVTSLLISNKAIACDCIKILQLKFVTFFYECTAELMFVRMLFQSVVLYCVAVVHWPLFVFCLFHIQIFTIHFHLLTTCPLCDSNFRISHSRLNLNMLYLSVFRTKKCM